MKIRLQRAWIFALAALGLAEVAQAQVATPYLSSNRSHINPVGAVWRETGNLRYNMLDAGDVAKQDVGFSLIGESAGGEVDFVINETFDGGANSTNGTGFRGGFKVGESFAIGYGMGTYSGDVSNETSDLGLGLKFFDNIYASFLSRDGKAGENSYSVAGLGAGIISGNPTDLQWKFEYASLSASEDAYSTSLTVIEAKTNELNFFLEMDDGKNYDQQLLGLGWEYPDSWAFGVGMYTRDSESGFKFTIGYNYKNVSRLSSGGSQPQQQQQEPPPEEQAQ
ncbi:MAG: hypothetical protein VW543_14730 [Deltaproteobacteria bacterium]